MKLQVQICTMGNAGIDRVAEMNLPRLESITYLLCVQLNPSEELYVPVLLQRDDVKIVVSHTKGLSINRNIGLTQGDKDCVVLIGDDDVQYTGDGLQKVLKTFEDDSDLDFATFKYGGPDNKRYPDKSFAYGCGEMPSFFYISSIELAVRADRLSQDIRFPEFMGLGTSVFGCMEESVFVRQMVLRGMRGRFVPIQIALHPNLSTGNRRAIPALLRARGFWLRYRFGFLGGAARILLTAIHDKDSSTKVFRYMASGFYLYSKYKSHLISL